MLVRAVTAGRMAQKPYHEQDPVHGNGMAEVLPQEVQPALALIKRAKHAVAMAMVDGPQEVAGRVCAQHS